MLKKSEAPLPDEICYKNCQINFTTRTPWCTSNNVNKPEFLVFSTKKNGKFNVIIESFS